MIISHYNAMKVVFYSNFHSIFSGQVAHLLFPLPPSSSFPTFSPHRCFVTLPPFPALVQKLAAVREELGAQAALERDALADELGSRHTEERERLLEEAKERANNILEEVHMRMSPCRSTAPRRWRQAPTRRLRSSFRPQWTAQRACSALSLQGFLVLVVAVDGMKALEIVCFL